MRLRGKLFTSAVIAFSISACFLTTPKPLGAGPGPGPTIFVGSTTFVGNLGLSYCPGPVGVGCIEKVIIDGVELTPINDPLIADYRVGGGVYARSCRLTNGEKTQCQYPYLEFRKTQSPFNMNTVELHFKRAESSEQELRLGSTVVGGELISFTPALVEGPQSAIVVARTELYQDGAVPWPRCVGLQFLIEDCTPDEIAREATTNRLSILLIPGLNSPVFPPEIENVNPSCAGPQDPRSCFTTVIEDSSLGTWVDSNASFTGPSGSSLQTGSLEFKLGGPRLKFGSDPASTLDSDLNLARFRYFLPSSYLQTAFGLNNNEADGSTLPVRRLTGSTATTPITTYTPVNNGVIVETSNISFSLPTFSIQRVITVERGRPIDVNQFFTEAGLSRAVPFGIPLLAPSQIFVEQIGDSLVFTSSGSYVLTVNYLDSVGNNLNRFISVNVLQPSTFFPPNGGSRPAGTSQELPATQ